MLPCACIDIGSNTTRLLVADTRDGRLREVLQDRVFTRLGADGAIGPGKIAEVAEAVAAQVRAAREAGAASIRAVGTHALRQAPNRHEVLAAIERASGVRVEILSGDEEALYAFRGATHALAAGNGTGEVGVVDVGGGSTEVVCGSPSGGVTWSASLPVGSGSLADAHLRSDPPSAAELDEVRARAAESLGALDVPRPAAAFAVGGSATSLGRLVGPVLDHTTLERAVGLLAALPRDEAARRFDLHPERVRLLPAGILLLDAAAAALGTPLRIAGGGLREGVLLDALDREAAVG